MIETAIKVMIIGYAISFGLTAILILVLIGFGIVCLVHRIKEKRK